jgi:hypothetical protein
MTSFARLRVWKILQILSILRGRKLVVLLLSFALYETIEYLIIPCVFYHRCCEGSAAEFELRTKYYNAKLLLHPHESKVLDGVYGSQSLYDALKCTEGYIDIVPFDKVRRRFFREQKHSLSNIKICLNV